MRTKEECQHAPLQRPYPSLAVNGNCSSSATYESVPGELKQDLDGISQKVLTDSLRSLEKDGIITRTVYPEIPPRVEYALSPIGKCMEPIILAMETWGKKYQALLSEEK